MRPGFAVRKVVILKWIFLGNILTMAYKTTLLSSLIPIQYENTIDNMKDLDDSGKSLIMAKASTFYEHVSSDQRPFMRRILNRSIFINLDGGIPQWALEM